MTERPRRPAVDGWFTEIEGGRGVLQGLRCRTCGTIAFPPTLTFCPNPDCSGDGFESVPLSREGTIWSFTDARYAPPAPYVVRGPEHTPFAIVAAALEAECMVVLGQAVEGVSVDDLHVGQPVEVVVEVLDESNGTDLTVWKWRPTEATT